MNVDEQAAKGGLVAPDYRRLIGELQERFVAANPRSDALNARARDVMVTGGNHELRLTPPFPPRVADARGAYVTDVDGHRLVDWWQGHFANILGHAPEAVTTVLAEAFAGGYGLQLGIPDEQTVELAELLAARVHAERVRLTTSGTLATMYAVMLARAFTGRSTVVKSGGGWHGAQPWALKGVGFHPGPEPWRLESEGLPACIDDEIMITLYNEPEDLEHLFARRGDGIACLIIEPVAGVGDFMFATPEYLRRARELTDRHGALLILDEVISGFRICAGDLGSVYGVRPDLITVGKIIGGGMPVAAVGGRADVMSLAGRDGGSRVNFQGGTYSAHPASLLAGRLMIDYLVEHEADLYPALAARGAALRSAVEQAFADEGVAARCSGAPPPGLPGSSVTALHFPLTGDDVPSAPHRAYDPSLYDVALKTEVLQIGLLLDGMFTLFSSLALSAAHSDDDVARLCEACRSLARMVRRERERDV